MKQIFAALLISLLLLGLAGIRVSIAQDHAPTPSPTIKPSGATPTPTPIVKTTDWLEQGGAWLLKGGVCGAE